MKFFKISAIALCLFLNSCMTDHAEPIKAQAKKQYRSWNQNLELLESKTIEFKNLDKDITYMADFKWIGNDKFSFVDSYYTRQAYIFNKDGTLDCELGSRGEGPGEYESPTGLTFDGNHYYLTSTNARLNVYNKDCSFKEMYHLPSNVTIAKGLHNSPDGKLLLPVFSRYSENSIYLLTKSGQNELEFSPLDTDFPNGFDTFNPQGAIALSGKRTLQFFNHRYEILFFDSNHKEEKRVRLASTLYVEPDYSKAKSLKNGKEEIAFRASFTQFIGLKPFKGGWVTILRSWPNSKEFRDTIEFWDDTFTGYGRFTSPKGEVVVGSQNDELIFFKVEDTSSSLIFRKLGAT